MEQLRILACNPDGGAFKFIVQSIGNAFRALGHQFEHWDGQDAQVDRLKPHIYLGCSGWRQNYPGWARTKYKTKIGIHVNPWGSTRLQALPGEPDINETQEAIRWVESQKPNFLYCYAIESDIQHMWNNWTKIATVIPMPTAGDATIHQPVPPDPNFKCNIGFIGGFWPYKGINITKYLIPVINQTDAKVYGWGGWNNHPKYRGNINDGDVNKLFSSAKICPAIVEPHTSRYGIDIPERMFKVPLGGGFTILDACAGIERYVSRDVFPLASSPQHYKELIDRYLVDNILREELKKQQRLAILRDHTYFSRIQAILKVTGYDEQMAQAQSKVDQLVKNAMV